MRRGRRHELRTMKEELALLRRALARARARGVPDYRLQRARDTERCADAYKWGVEVAWSSRGRRRDWAADWVFELRRARRELEEWS